MMSFDEFKKEVVLAMEQRIGEGNVHLQNCIKNNDTKKVGLLLKSSDSNVSPVIYLEDYYKELQRKPFYQILEDIWQTYQKHKAFVNLDTSMFMQWSAVREKVVMKVINYNYNQELLKSVPHDRFLDLAVVYYYILDTKEDHEATVLIQNHHMDLWEIDKDELKSAAWHNYQKFYEISVQGLDEAIMEMMGMSLSEMEQRPRRMQPILYLVTNQRQINGATAILFPDKMKALAEYLQTDLYILPSSIHELLAFPKTLNMAEKLKEIVHDINVTSVQRAEVLSDEVYLYSRDTGEIELAVA